MIGEIINGYKITEKIGEGGMATVYKGVHINSTQFAKAFKVVRPDRAENNPALYTRFLREIELLNRLDGHQNIVRAENVHHHNNTTVLEMEYLDGLDLQQFIEKKAPNGLSDVSQLKKIAKQILEGLSVAHANGILHLDIKPSNIFRTRYGHLKLLDFGIATVVGEKAENIQGARLVTMKTETGESTFKGTAAFASPEQQAGTTLGVTSDIFSFGKTLHFITTGTNDPSAECTVAPFDAIINKCTQDKPRLRFQNCQEILDWIENPPAKTTNILDWMENPGPAKTTKCSGCGKKIDGSVKFCPHCGTKQESSPKPELKCPHCGTVSKTPGTFCGNCGKSLQYSPVQYKACPTCGKQYKMSDNFCNYCVPATKLVVKTK
ncbi:MAG: protein kinase [Culturomica sp.]|jgi:serine/threonine protein kinase|nr:protein kinase [Culturomica sp.]